MKFFPIKSILLLFLFTFFSMNTYAATYQIDDGTGEDSIGLFSLEKTTYMNQFTTPGTGDYISSIEIAWGKIYNGMVSKIFVWDDPNNDGSPIDRIALYSSDVIVDNANTDIFNIFNVPRTYVLGSFFIGFEYFASQEELDSSNYYPGRLDQDHPKKRSWVGANSAELEFDLIDNFDFPGNWMIRANGDDVSPVPEPSTMILLGAGLLGLIGVGRKSRQ